MAFQIPTQNIRQTQLRDQIKQHFEREREQSAKAAFDAIVTEAVELADLQGIGAFEAADWATRKHNYEDFQSVLEQVRIEVDCR